MTHPPHSREFFDEHMAMFTQGREAMRSALERLPAAKEELLAAKDTLEQIKATVVANGGLGDMLIDGKNEAQRSAQLTAALETYDPYLRARRDVREMETHIGAIEADVTEAGDLMRQARLALEYATAHMNRQAAMEGGRALNERTGR